MARIVRSRSSRHSSAAATPTQTPQHGPIMALPPKQRPAAVNAGEAGVAVDPSSLGSLSHTSASTGTRTQSHSLTPTPTSAFSATGPHSLTPTPAGGGRPDRHVSARLARASGPATSALAMATPKPADRQASREPDTEAGRDGSAGPRNPPQAAYSAFQSPSPSESLSQTQSPSLTPLSQSQVGHPHVRPAQQASQQALQLARPGQHQSVSTPVSASAPAASSAGTPPPPVSSKCESSQSQNVRSGPSDSDSGSESSSSPSPSPSQARFRDYSPPVHSPFVPVNGRRDRVTKNPALRVQTSEESGVASPSTAETTRAIKTGSSATTTRPPRPALKVAVESPLRAAASLQDATTTGGHTDDDPDRSFEETESETETETESETDDEGHLEKAEAAGNPPAGPAAPDGQIAESDDQSDLDSTGSLESESEDDDDEPAEHTQSTPQPRPLTLNLKKGSADPAVAHTQPNPSPSRSAPPVTPSPATDSSRRRRAAAQSSTVSSSARAASFSTREIPASADGTAPRSATPSSSTRKRSGSIIAGLTGFGEFGGAGSCGGVVGTGLGASGGSVTGPPLERHEFDAQAVELACRVAKRKHQTDLVMTIRDIGLNEEDNADYSDIMDTIRHLRPLNADQVRIVSGVIKGWRRELRKRTSATAAAAASARKAAAGRKRHSMPATSSASMSTGRSKQTAKSTPTRSGRSAAAGSGSRSAPGSSTRARPTPQSTPVTVLKQEIPAEPVFEDDEDDDADEDTDGEDEDEDGDDEEEEDEQETDEDEEEEQLDETGVVEPSPRTIPLPAVVPVTPTLAPISTPASAEPSASKESGSIRLRRPRKSASTSTTKPAAKPTVTPAAKSTVTPASQRQKGGSAKGKSTDVNAAATPVPTPPAVVKTGKTIFISSLSSIRNGGSTTTPTQTSPGVKKTGSSGRSSRSKTAAAAVPEPVEPVAVSPVAAVVPTVTPTGRKSRRRSALQEIVSNKVPVPDVPTGSRRRSRVSRAQAAKPVEPAKTEDTDDEDIPVHDRPVPSTETVRQTRSTAGRKRGAAGRLAAAPPAPESTNSTAEPTPMSEDTIDDYGAGDDLNLDNFLQPSPAGGSRRQREPQHKRLTPGPRSRKEPPPRTRRTRSQRAQQPADPDAVAEDPELVRRRSELTKTAFPGYSVADSNERPPIVVADSDEDVVMETALPVVTPEREEVVLLLNRRPRLGRGVKRGGAAGDGVGTGLSSGPASSRPTSPAGPAKRQKTLDGYFPGPAEPKETTKKRGRAGGKQPAAAAPTSAPASVPESVKSVVEQTCRLCDIRDFGLLECAHCSTCYHPECLELPVRPESVTAEWCCPDCQSEPPQSPPLSPHNIFQTLVKEIDYIEPELYAVPDEIVSFFDGVGRKSDGSYHDTTEAIPIRNRTGYNIQTVDHLKLKDSRNVTIHCVHCSRTALTGRPIITCDDCGSHWHLDCVDPPLANVPADFANGKFRYRWLCPRHSSHDIRQLANDFGRAHYKKQAASAVASGTRTLRRCRMAKAVTDVPDEERRFHRIRKLAEPRYVDLSIRPSLAAVGADIEFVDQDSDEEYYSDHEEDDQGEMVTYRMPTRGVKLDFIARFKRAPELLFSKTELASSGRYRVPASTPIAGVVGEYAVPTMLSDGAVVLNRVVEKLARPCARQPCVGLDLLAQAALQQTPTAAKPSTDEGECGSGDKPAVTVVSPPSPPVSESVTPAISQLVTGADLAVLERLRDAIDVLVQKSRVV